MSRNRAGTARAKERRTIKPSVLRGLQGGQAWGGNVPARRLKPLTRAQLKAVRRDKMDDRAEEQVLRGTALAGRREARERQLRARP